LANIAENPVVSVLVDEYDDKDWTRLWWVRADGSARVLDPGSFEARWGIDLLCKRYAQYVERPPGGPLLAVEVERWSGWDSSGR
jgi:PPOX class probable F420-dependent enzyme